MTITDTKDFTVTLSTPTNPDPVIVNTTAPSQAAQGAAVVVTVSIHNVGAAGSCWAQMLDKDTGATVGARQTVSLQSNGTNTFNFTLTMPNKNWKLRVQVGTG